MIREIIQQTRLYSRLPLFYDQWIRAWSSLLGGLGPMRDEAFSLLAPGPGEKILDLCCGTGRFTLPLVHGSREVIGVDASAKMLSYLAAREGASGLRLVTADARHLPFAGGVLDKVLLCGALHEMPTRDRQRVLREMHRVLRPGGRSLVVEPAYPTRSVVAKGVYRLLFNPLNPESRTLRQMHQRGLAREIAESGFRILRRRVTNKGFMEHVLSTKDE